MMRSGSGPRRTRMRWTRWPCNGWWGWVTLTHSSDPLVKGVVDCEYAYHKGSLRANSAENAHGTDLGGRFLLLLERISARTMYDGLRAALVPVMQYYNRIPMGD